MIRRIIGKGFSANVQHLKDGDIITDKRDISNKLADTLAKHSSSNNYAPQFRKHKEREEKNMLKFKTDNTEYYKKPFSFEELISSLNKTRDTIVKAFARLLS